MMDELDEALLEQYMRPSQLLHRCSPCFCTGRNPLMLLPTIEPEFAELLKRDRARHGNGTRRVCSKTPPHEGMKGVNPVQGSVSRRPHPHSLRFQDRPIQRRGGGR